jgi:enoyl-CoA hydratase/carnithine racemase
MNSALIENTPITHTRADTGVALLTLNRSRQRNAMSMTMVAELLVALERAENDVETRVVMLSGAGTGFCAGSDLSDLAKADAGARRRFEAESGRLARTIAALRKPVIAAAHGFAIGGGLTLAAACDIVVTGSQSRWSLPEVAIGLFPAWGLTAVVDRVGRSAARRLTWGFETLDGAQALRIGLADRVVEGDVAAEALQLARQIAALPASSAASVKEYFGADLRGEEADHLANRLFLHSCESAEAIASFHRFSK